MSCVLPARSKRWEPRHMEQYLLPIGVCVGVLFVLVVGVEIVITMHQVRKNFTRITNSTCETLDQVQPVVQKIDASLDDLAPSIARMDALTQKTERTLDALNEELEVAHVILDNASEISKKTIGVSNALTQAAESTISGITGCASSFAKNFIKGYKSARKSVEGAHTPKEIEGMYAYGEADMPQTPSTNAGNAAPAPGFAHKHAREKSYITYGAASASAAPAAQAPVPASVTPAASASQAIETAPSSAHESSQTSFESTGTTHASE